MARTFDVWCLGCLFLDFLTWFLGGPELWEEFERERMKTPGTDGYMTPSFFEPLVNTEEGPYVIQVKESVSQVRLRSHSPLRWTSPCFLPCLCHSGSSDCTVIGIARSLSTMRSISSSKTCSLSLGKVG